MDKKSIRKKILDIRENIKEDTKSELDKLIFNYLINNEIYKNAKRIFIYVSYKNEVDTKNIIRYSLSEKKQIYVPKTFKEEKSMKAININSLDELIVDNYSILEPKVVDKNHKEVEFDLIIMPAVSFDKKGNRIGYGAGYYDRYISKLDYDIIKIGLAYDFQIVHNIDSEEHDVKVDYIITNKGEIKIRGWFSAS